MSRRAVASRVASRVAVLVLAGAMLAGCRGSGPSGQAPAGEPQASDHPEGSGIAADPAPASEMLAGTTWRLVELQSMDDRIGTVRPDDPSLYTMHLDRDGSVQMRLNCNRANGTWSAEPGNDGSSGGFRFGPLAGTRALCPPPSLDEQIAQQAEFVRSYLVKDGLLHLSLMADGGIQTWEPLPLTPGEGVRR